MPQCQDRVTNGRYPKDLLLDGFFGLGGAEDGDTRSGVADSGGESPSARDESNKQKRKLHSFDLYVCRMKYENEHKQKLRVSREPFEGSRSHIVTVIWR